MATIINPEIKTILPNDPTFASLEYEALRQLGLEHIGNLSGRIWTDHNVHDPGITTLEMLCYALLDLGYRTKLPIGQMVADDPADHNALPQFYSPAQILSSEPTTILDYRRLLLDIPGIKNAWLEVVRDEIVEVDLPSQTEELSTCKSALNGLYRIILQLETADPSEESKILTQVRQTLLAHRNLGEDFVNLDCPIILEAFPIALSAQIEIQDAADPATVFKDIVGQLNQYFCPELHYYTLGELLAKGKNIEEIYAGRPYTTDSFGFVDPDELLTIKQQKEIHFSDLYSLILQVEGVKRIRNIKSQKSPDDLDSQDLASWVFRLPQNQFPVFDLEGSAISLFRKNELYEGRSLKESKVFKQALSDRQKVRYHSAYPNLDLEPAKEVFREDLADYYSIQHEFPKVYGIGLDGLGPSASAERQAKALQFKGYLLFFERLLADFLAQLGAIKSYFALIPESERPQAYQRTYFAQSLESVPQIEALNRLSGFAKRFGWTSGKAIARLVHKKDLLGIAAAAPLNHDPEIPAFTFEHLENRSIAIQNIKTAFQANQDIHIIIAINEFGEGFRFGIYFDAYEYAWLSEQDYASEAEARNAATLMGAQLAWPKSLKLLSEPCHTAKIEGETKHQYSIQWIYAPPEELSYLQLLMESPRQYQARRHQFLDHLLARFAEQFTDYSLQMYAMFGANHSTDTKLLEVKSQYLSRFDRLAHDRGRAFDYGQTAWGTSNLSGLEANLSARLGLNWESRQSLSPFVPITYQTEYELKLRIDTTSEWLEATRNYLSKQEALADLKLAIEALRKGDALKIGDGIEQSNKQISLDFEGGTLLSHQLFHDATSQQMHLLAWDQQFREAAKAENTAITRYAYRLQLKDISEQILLEDQHSTDNEAQTWQGEAKFIKAYQDSVNQKPDQNIKLIPYPGNEKGHVYFDINQLGSVLSVDAPRFRWQIRFNDQSIFTSEQDFPDKESAEQTILTLLASPSDKLSLVEKNGQFTLCFKDKSCAYSSLGKGADTSVLLDWLQQHQSGQQYVKRVDQGFRWQLIDLEADKALLLEAPTLHANKQLLERSWAKFKASGTTASNYSIKALSDNQWEVELKNNKGEVIARSPKEGIIADSQKTLLKRLQKLFQRKTNSRIITVEEAYSFQIADNESNVSLQSFKLYLNAAEAWAALVQLPKLGKTVKNFVLSGNELDLNYSFYLQDAKGIIFAVHPQTYEEESLSKAQVKIAKALLKAFQLPYQTQAEYRFLYSLNQGLSLAGSEWFLTNQKARAEGRKYLSQLAHPDFVNQDTVDEHANACVILEVNDKEIARSQGEYKTDEIKASLQAWDQQLQQTRLQVDIDAKPDQWQFFYYWPQSMQTWELLLQSVNGYDSDLAAQNAYVDFVQRLPNLSVLEGENLTISVLDGESHWLRSAAFATATDRTDAINWFNTQRQEAAIIRSLESQELDSNADIPPSLSANISQTKISQSGVFGYQVLKKESPLAVLKMSANQIEANTELNCGDHSQAIQEADILSKIPLSGDVYRLINGRFHYEVRWQINGQEMPFFVSEKGYDSATEAISALNAEYIKVFHLASNVDNYAADVDDRNAQIVFRPHSQEEGCTQEYSQRTFVFVPEESFRFFDQSIEGAISALLNSAISFPLKQQNFLCRENEIIALDTPLYFFQFWQARDEEWQSFQSYESPEAVSVAWDEFWDWKDHRESYHRFEDWSEEWTCQWEARSKGRNQDQQNGTEHTNPNSVPTYCAIYKTLLESSVRHEELNNVWCSGPVESTSANPMLGVATLARYGGVNANYLIYWDYILNSYRVIVGSDIHQFVEHPESFQQPEDRDQRLQSLLQNRSYTKLAPSILADPAQIYQNESVIISEETPGNYRYYVYSRQDSEQCLAWRSKKIYAVSEYGDHSEAKHQAFLAYNIFCEAWNNTDHSNWAGHEIAKATQDSACGPYRIIGLDPVQEIAHYPMSLDTYEAAVQLLQEAYACLNAEGFHLLEHILFRPRTTNKLDQSLASLHAFDAVKECEVSFVPDLQAGECDCTPANEQSTELPNTYVPLFDPISFWGTLVLPKWSYRYRFENFKALLLDELNAYAPAHMAFKICWLPPYQMDQFEASYRKWLKSLRQTKICKAGEELDSSLQQFDDFTRTFLEQKYCSETEREDCKEEEGSGAAIAILDEQTPTMQTRSLGPAPQRPTPKAVAKPKSKAKTRPKKKTKNEEAAKVPSLSQREKTRLIRQRLATYQSFLKTVENKNILKSGSYKRLEVLFTSLGTPAEIKAFVDFLFQYPLKKQQSKTYADYLPLLYQAVSFGLDHALIAKTSQSLTQWPAIISALKNNQIKLKDILALWNPKAMKALVEPERLNTLEALLKK